MCVWWPSRRTEWLVRLAQIDLIVRQFIEYGLITEPAEAVLARIEGVVTTDVEEAVEGCTYAVETIQELLEPKRELLAGMMAADPDLMIGSNTGSFTVDTLTEGLPCPHNVTASTTSTRPTHPTGGGSSGSATTDAVYRRKQRLQHASGKNTVLERKVFPGFIVNSLMGALNVRSTSYWMRASSARRTWTWP
jgi:3-hydroxyacyl-CoA dehydrogenase